MERRRHLSHIFDNEHKESKPVNFIKEQSSCWYVFVQIMTMCIPSFCLSLCNMKTKQVQHAWREKVTLCLIILGMCGILAFVTYIQQPLLCPNTGLARSPYSKIQSRSKTRVVNTYPKYVLIRGQMYKWENISDLLPTNMPEEVKGKDLSTLFPPPKYSKKCKALLQLRECEAFSFKGCYDLSKYTSWLWPYSYLAYEWEDIAHSDLRNSFLVFNGLVIDVSAFIGSVTDHRIIALLKKSLGQDGTRILSTYGPALELITCASYQYTVGVLDKEKPGCFISNVMTFAMFVVIVLVIIIRFVLAVGYRWFIVPSITNPKLPSKKEKLAGTFKDPSCSDRVIALVTCYSEGEQSLRTTLDSIANTDYPDENKLLFVIADGNITGSGNDRSTPQILLDFMEIDNESTGKNPESCSYFAIAAGSQQHNMAKVYAGYYVTDTNRTPMLLVVKCGTPEEATMPKPGNRGKRDSQLILMHFLSRSLLNDRMTPLDFDIFRKLQSLTGYTPDQYELVLMVDADTKVLSRALRSLVITMSSDEKIMGICGETRIANKRTSWVTAIQVFEYHISHFLGKGFESVFGGVTCLPGCFCMYRVKAKKKDGYYVPLLANPDIIEIYSQNEVISLHSKNLLLLGEDRFLTTLMLKTFPKRKMMFTPDAVCKTIVPDTFKVLLSQRRRWINSTIHNLMELVLVRDLCGIFCFSMQFIVFLELTGTVVLPAAISFTLYLIISGITSGKPEWLPILLLILILGSPAFLIMMTTGKIIYVAWMLIYLFSLPIWNFVLPTYAFWHFDDFSWGETRKVEGVSGKADHGNGEGSFDTSLVPLKTWAEYERRRRYNLFRESNMDDVDSYYSEYPLRRSYGSRYGSTSSLTSLGAMSEASSHLEIVGILDDDLERLSENSCMFSPSICSDDTEYTQSVRKEFSSSKLKKDTRHV